MCLFRGAEPILNMSKIISRLWKRLAQKTIRKTISKPATSKVGFAALQYYRIVYLQFNYLNFFLRLFPRDICEKGFSFTHCSPFLGNRDMMEQF